MCVCVCVGKGGQLNKHSICIEESWGFMFELGATGMGQKGRARAGGTQKQFLWNYLVTLFLFRYSWWWQIPARRSLNCPLFISGMFSDVVSCITKHWRHIRPWIGRRSTSTTTASWWWPTTDEVYIKSFIHPIKLNEIKFL